VEQKNTYKLVFLLVTLLVKNSGETYGSLESPPLTNLWPDIQALAKKEEIYSEELACSTVYNKLGQALNIPYRIKHL
jgi:hypothetical protein